MGRRPTRRWRRRWEGFMGGSGHMFRWSMGGSWHFSASPALVLPGDPHRHRSPHRLRCGTMLPVVDLFRLLLCYQARASGGEVFLPSTISFGYYYVTSNRFIKSSRQIASNTPFSLESISSCSN